MRLPLSIDRTPEGEFVDRAGFHEPGYQKNIEYNLQLMGGREDIHIGYYGENDTYLEEEEIRAVLKKFNPGYFMEPVE